LIDYGLVILLVALDAEAYRWFHQKWRTTETEIWIYGQSASNCYVC